MLLNIIQEDILESQEDLGNIPSPKIDYDIINNLSKDKRKNVKVKNKVDNTPKSLLFFLNNEMDFSKTEESMKNVKGLYK